MNRPDLGKHDMTDPNAVSFMVECASLEKEDIVLDIGAGNGVLTKEVDKRCRCIAVETDEGSVQHLRNLPLKNTTIVSGNILDLIDSLTFTKIVANIPYAISEPLFYALAKRNVNLAIMTIGENFYAVVAGDTKVGIVFRSRYRVEKLKDLPRDSFTPPPRVDSCIIKATGTASNDKTMEQLLFLDEKKLKNALDRIFEKRIARRDLAKRIESYSAQHHTAFFDKSLKALSNEEMRLLVRFLNDL